jgi:TetR/AcrR family transcriptional repressor of mexJK operon
MRIAPPSQRKRRVASTAKPRIAFQPRRPLGRPRTKDVEALQARILFVARQTFARNGYGAASINEIARAARVSKNTLYARFPSKAALFRAIVRQQIDALEDTLQPASLGHYDTLEERLRAYANIALDASLNGDILQTNRLIYSESNRFPELGDTAAARNRVGIQQVSQFIKEYAARGGIPCRDPDRAAELFIMMINGWYSSVMVTNRSVTTEERKTYVDGAIQIFMTGLRS